MTPLVNKLYNKILENVEHGITALQPSDLYNFYFLATLISLNEIKGEYASFIAKDYMLKIKTKYLKLFGDLVYKQIEKYIRRQRVDPEVTLELLQNNKGNLPVLDQLMRKTYRSDMRRRNDVWNLVTEYLVKLNNATSIKDISFFVDRINNCIHNTDELLFSKFANWESLMRAFNEIHHAKSLNNYKNKVTKDIRQITDDIH